jgi:hypothetical protein
MLGGSCDPVPFSKFNAYNLDFDQCRNNARSRYMTCSTHSSRELAAREFICELENLHMSDIAYVSEADEAADRQKRRDELRRKYEAWKIDNSRPS